ncbi:MAG: hypothetical protein K8R85_07165 [Bacteroidetes bacterium]|nr:hypothetical protein [Bacteroidota bacterium]
MKIQKINTDRLVHLAQHLFGNELHTEPHTIVDKPKLIRYEDGSFQYIEPFFRYVVQELLYIFPDEWHVTAEGEPAWKKDKEQRFETSLTAFFGISEAAVLHMIMPGRQNLERFGGKILNNNSTHFDIAINIIEFVTKLEMESIVSANAIFLN